MCVCMYVVCTFGHFNIWSWPNVQYEVFESLYRSVTPKITGKAHVNRRPTSVFRHGSSRPLYIFPCRNHMGHCPGEPSYGYLSPSRSGPETGFVAIVLFLSLSYCLSNNELRRLASYYATSNFYVHEFPAFAPYVTHTTINARTHTSLYLCKCMCVWLQI